MIKLKNINWILSYVAILAMTIQPLAHAKESAKLIANVSAMNAMNEQLQNQTPINQSYRKGVNTKKAIAAKKPEQLLSELTQEIYWDLYDWKEKDLRSFNVEQKQKITDWQTKLNDLHQQVMVEMDTLTAWIDEKKLAPVIQQRQQDAITHINTEVAGLKAHLSQMSSNSLDLSSEEAVSQSLNASFDFFAGKQLKRKHQVFDGLSSVALTPDRIPAAKSIADFSKYQFESHSKSSIGSLKNFTDPELLSTSDEVVINDFINAKATELENDPVKIYHWVRNNIEWLPSYGAVQASDITLGSGRGNAFDQTSLLIALLRASDVPSRYAYGTIEVEIDKFTNWVGLTNPEAAITFAQYGGIPIATIIEGGVITKVQMEHIWVEAAIDFMPSRGAVNITPDSWVTLDPSFKQYETLAGLDPIAISGQNVEQLAQDLNDSATIEDQNGVIQGFDLSIVENAQSQIEESMEVHINDNFNNPTVGDLSGGRRVILKEYPVLPASTKNKVVVKAGDFIEMTEVFRPKYRIAFNRDILGEIQNPLELNFAELNNHKLNLSFKPATQEDLDALSALIPDGTQNIEDISKNIPAHLIKVLPQIALDEMVVKTGSPIFLGYDLDLFFQIKLSTGQILNNSYLIPSGSFVSLMFNSGSISEVVMKDVKNKLLNTKHLLETGDISSVTRENIMGDLFFMTSLIYDAENFVFSNMLAKAASARFNSSPIYGTSGFEPNVNYLFGLPINVNNGSVSFNLYTTRQITSENNASTLILNQLNGSLDSFLEHSVPEQMFNNENSSTEAVSSIKLLSKALSSNQSLFVLNNDTISNLDSDININPESELEIKQAVNSGYIVVVHGSDIDLDGWNGAGYIIANPNTGDASFKITGGRNGGDMEEPFDGFGALIALSDSADILSELLAFVASVIAFVFEFIVLEAGLHLYALYSNLSSLVSSCGSDYPFATIFISYLFFIVYSFALAISLILGAIFLPVIGFLFFVIIAALLSVIIFSIGQLCVLNPGKQNELTEIKSKLLSLSKEGSHLYGY